VRDCKCGRPGSLFVAWTSDDRRKGGPHGDALLCADCGAAVLSAIEQPSRTLDELERDAIKRALERANGNVTEAARVLGVHRSKLYRWRQLLALSLLALGCAGHSEEEQSGPQCREFEWSAEWCDARQSPQFVVVCDGGERGELSTDGTWSGAPYPACAPAEHRPELVAWCCWGKP
jgi:hypothetical protein